MRRASASSSSLGGGRHDFTSMAAHTTHGAAPATSERRSVKRRVRDCDAVATSRDAIGIRLSTRLTDSHSVLSLPAHLGVPVAPARSPRTCRVRSGTAMRPGTAGARAARPAGPTCRCWNRSSRTRTSRSGASPAGPVLHAVSGSRRGLTDAHVGRAMPGTMPALSSIRRARLAAPLSRGSTQGPHTSMITFRAFVTAALEKVS